MLHFRGGLVGKCQAQDFLAGEFRLGLEKVADALGDDASLARAGAGHHDQRSLAVLRRGALFGIELNAGAGAPTYSNRSAILNAIYSTVAHG